MHAQKRQRTSFIEPTSGILQCMRSESCKKLHLLQYLQSHWSRPGSCKLVMLQSSESLEAAFVSCPHNGLEW
eukprot:1527222-Amphidinium_carterae.1